MEGMDLVLGVDAGGTASKAVVTTRSGRVLGRGSAGPGNPSAIGSAAATAIGSAVQSALGDLDAGSVVAGVVGVAGVSRLADPGVAAAFAASWAALGLTCKITVVGDAVTALAAGASGTAGGTGTVLVSGTGAVAALVDGLRVVRTIDGLGWLLGDEGSGMWLGLQAVRAAARYWSPDGLPAAVAAAAGVTNPDDLVHWAAALPLRSFAALAPTVCTLATNGDPLATRITGEAVTRLLSTLDELRAPGVPVVLAGTLLVANTPIRRGVVAALRARGTDPGTALDPALGAARLAAHSIAARPAAASVVES